MSRPVVSIIVPTRRRPTLLKRCLASIEETVEIPHEVIVVTDADADAHTDTDAHAVAHTDADAHAHTHTITLTAQGRAGYVRAANAGLRAATGTYVTIVNDDCTLLPHAIANAVRFLEVPAHAGVGQAAFFHDTPVKRNVHAQVDVEGVRYVVCHVRGLCYANFGLARRELAERLGYLDERYFMYGADPDFSLKVWHEAGLSVAPCPGALVHHEETDDPRARHDRARQDLDNAKLFAKWHMQPAEPSLLWRASTGC